MGWTFSTVRRSGTSRAVGGRGNLRVAKTPPLQSALRGGGCGGLPPTIIHAHTGINWKDVEGKRRSTPRRDVLREMGESGLNRRIPKGGTLQKSRAGSIFTGGFPLPTGKEILIMRFRFSKTVATRRAASFMGAAENPISTNFRDWLLGSW